MKKPGLTWMAALAGLGWFVQPLLFAGPVSLNSAEILRLQNLVSNDTTAAKLFFQIRTNADAALPAKANPVETVVSEGHLETDPEKIRTTAALADMNKIESIAWAWAATGGARYSDKAHEFILAWARVNHSDGNPINETKFQPLIIAYDLLRDTFPEAERTTVDQWLQLKAERLWKSTKGRTGNWQSHRLKIVGLIGLTVNDPALWKFASDGYRKQIGMNIAPDGASDDFKKRDALHYHLYSVEPLLTLALAGERHGEKLLAYTATNGASLKKAVDFVIPFAEGAKTHVEFANTTVAFDRQRAASGETEYQPHPWNSNTAIEMFSEAAEFDSSYAKLVAKISGETNRVLLNWRMVINAASSNIP